MSEPTPTESTGANGPSAGTAAASPQRRIDRVLGRAFIADLPSLPVSVLRERRAEASAEESDLSYLRRVLHGRLDIIAAECARRAGGDQSPLVARLAEILADAPSSRIASARHLGLGGEAAIGEYRAAMEARLRELALPDLAACSERTLRDTAAALSVCEREVSDLRRRVQGVADACAADLARRYREGEAAIDDLLAAD
ncbi:MAG TPA: aerial mycelium formation protein [Actinocrinis sp.]|uniref:RsiG family protein n=1 Tax=Actinocrinis sp. TaxID=1920516 RepID=UPI002D31F485|nr:aerial mycelium formation protein [Actinocrinis sp.]HZU57887.1 aerial mycelium formation protein [Actinocrinis sp.]